MLYRHSQGPVLREAFSSSGALSEVRELTRSATAALWGWELRLSDFSTDGSTSSLAVQVEVSMDGVDYALAYSSGALSANVYELQRRAAEPATGAVLVTSHDLMPYVRVTVTGAVGDGTAYSGTLELWPIVQAAAV